ncbi:hypothetical protein ACO0LD_23835 [Undibacterium sp. Ji83W]|uniref:hypothetical protein n=1 Tax=Undibacterium sp. Ji83W TaxID=3413043 RepID=UPI003BF27779
MPFVFILGISTALSFLGGWASLATQFRANQAATGERFRFVTGSMGSRFFPVNYGSCLFVTVSEQGLHLSVFFLFRMFSPPLFLPWSQMETVEKKRYFFRNGTVINMRGQRPKLMLLGAVAEAVATAYAKAEAQKGSRAYP